MLQGQIPVEFRAVFPDGAYAAGGFEMVRDFDRSTGERAVQQHDKDSGLPLWVIEVIDAQEKVRQRTVKVKVQSYVRLTASTYIHCSTYEDAAPILTIQDGAADITITNPGHGEVTEDDVRFGRLLAEAVNRYAAELERRAAKDWAAAVPGESAGRAP